MGEGPRAGRESLTPPGRRHQAGRNPWCNWCNPANRSSPISETSSIISIPAKKPGCGARRENIFARRISGLAAWSAPSIPARRSDLLRRLTDFLEYETDMDWDVALSNSSVETQRETETRERGELLADAAQHPDIAAALAAMPGAEVVDVERSAPLDPATLTDNVVPLKRSSKG